KIVMSVSIRRPASRDQRRLCLGYSTKERACASMGTSLLKRSAALLMRLRRAVAVEAGKRAGTARARLAAPPRSTAATLKRVLGARSRIGDDQPIRRDDRRPR